MPGYYLMSVYIPEEHRKDAIAFRGHVGKGSISKTITEMILRYNKENNVKVKKEG